MFDVRNVITVTKLQLKGSWNEGRPNLAQSILCIESAA